MHKIAHEGLKAGVAIAIFVLVQNHLAGWRSGFGGATRGLAHAESGRAAEARARDDFERLLEDSRAHLRAVAEELRSAAESLGRERGALGVRLIESEARLADGFGEKLASYRGSLDEALRLYDAANLRLRTLESQVRRVVPVDAALMERSMILPTIQLKGNKTVGSGVVISSAPAEKAGASGAGGAEIAAGPPAHTTYAVTAYHVVKEILGDDFPLGALEDVHYVGESDTPAMKVISAVVEIYDPELDLALLRLRTSEPFRHVAQLLPRREIGRVGLFTRVYAVGCPLGNTPLPTFGEISSKTKLVGDQVFWMVTAPTFFGNSGGGIFLSDTCELVGISSMIYTYTYGMNRSMVVPHMGLLVPIHAVCDWLERRGYGFIIESGESGRFLAPLPAIVGGEDAGHQALQARAAGAPQPVAAEAPAAAPKAPASAAETAGR